MEFAPPFEFDDVDVAREDDVVHLALASDRIDEGFVTDLRDAVIGVREDDTVRAVTLTGSGETFCVGADLGALSGDASDGRTIRRLAGTLHEAVAGFLRLPVPTVVAVNGVVAGGGLGLALSGDVVLASEAARFEFAYPRVGLTGDGGSTYLLPRIVGARRARELALLDEPIAPDRAVELGLATETVPADEVDARRRELAARVAAGPTWAYGETKALLLEGLDADLESHLAREADTIARATHTDDYARGHEAFFAKESPDFRGE